MTDRTQKTLKLRGPIFIILILSLFYPVKFSAPLLAADDSGELTVLTKQIIESSSGKELYKPFEELRIFYFKKNQYNEFIELLKSLAEEKKELMPFVDYYTALTRYQQLLHLENTKSWDEYFGSGSLYRQEIEEKAQSTIAQLASTDPLSIYARLLLWKFHHHQQDAQRVSSLDSLMNAILEYPPGATYLLPLKEVADELSSAGEKTKARKIYDLYVKYMVASDTKEEELKQTAAGFYQEGNLNLAQAIYDAYIDKIEDSRPKEELVPILINIARDFSYKDKIPCDPFYAEKIFKKLGEVGAKNVFDEELIYLRAFNLEKIKEFSRAKDIYALLTERFSRSKFSEEALFKMGVISAYIMRDIDSAKKYFEELAQRKNKNTHKIQSLYQLGLLSQWQQDEAKAKIYYDKLLESAGKGFPETSALAKKRLKELEETKPLDYDLRTFMDASLKEENNLFDVTKVALNSSLYRIEKDTGVTISAATFGLESGSLPTAVQYSWSGDLGSAKPSMDAATFQTTYTEPGTKIINVVALSPSGIIDRSIDIIDVY